jgi:non-homologous end joining protein Ku
LGFKPREYIKPYYNNRSSYFLYPNNKRVENSGKFFHAFIEQLATKKQVAIVRFIPKSNSRVRVGALFPQKE